MKKYLKDLPNKSEAHKRGFALAVSGGLTAVIFIVWTVVHFAPEPQLARETTGSVELVATEEPKPSMVANVFSAMGRTLDSLKYINVSK